MLQTNVWNTNAVYLLVAVLLYRRGLQGFRQYEHSDFSENLPLFSPILQYIYARSTYVASEINRELQRAIIDSIHTIYIFSCGIKGK